MNPMVDSLQAVPLFADLSRRDLGSVWQIR